MFDKKVRLILQAKKRVNTKCGKDIYKTLYKNLNL